MRLSLVTCILAFCCVSCSSSILLPPTGAAVGIRREPVLEGQIAEFPRRGHVTLLDFWSTSCAPCKRMMPSYQALWLQNRGAGLDIIGVAVDDNPGAVAAALKNLGVTYPVLLDTSGQVRGQYLVTSVPHTVVIDRGGHVRLFVSGCNDDELQRVEQGVREALSE